MVGFTGIFYCKILQNAGETAPPSTFLDMVSYAAATRKTAPQKGERTDLAPHAARLPGSPLALMGYLGGMLIMIRIQNDGALPVRGAFSPRNIRNQILIKCKCLGPCPGIFMPALK